jgi:hypothetical protein
MLANISPSLFALISVHSRTLSFFHIFKIIRALDQGYCQRMAQAIEMSLPTPPGEFVETWNPKGSLGIIAGKGFSAQFEPCLRRRFYALLVSHLKKIGLFLLYQLKAKMDFSL